MGRYAHCHFCDDIRLELGNKTSIMGMYNGEMFVETLPVVLPKLCFFVFFATDMEDPVKTLKIKISDKNSTLMEQAFDDNELQNAFAVAATKSTAENPIRQLTAGVNMMATPFVVSEENTVTVTVVADGEEMIAGRLRIRKAENGQPQA